ncbi:MAG: C39 family peptidase [Verrucomicrobiales bacterium]
MNEEIRHSRMLQAYKIAQEAGPLARWAPGGARTSAGRLVFWLGARRLSAALHITNHRHAPEDERALFYYACEYARRVGTYDALRFVEGSLPLIADQRVRADLLALSGFLLGTLRDFGAAFAALDEADAVLGEHDPWLMVERADVLEMADRRDEALALSQAALEIRPWYRPALLQTAGLLSQSDRDGEAIAVLEEALDHTENSGVPMRLQGFYSEQDDAENGLRCLELCERWMPLADKDLAEWIAARRSDYYYHLGDFEAARLHAEAAGEGFHEAVTKRLADPENWTKSRVRLPVGFVRQNRMTCGPATLTALSQYWGAKVDHLDVAEEICYDGTPAHSERRWAESRGMIAAEFRVTPEAIRALIDRGVPFTLTTVEPTSAHLQALIGYDDRIGVLLIRDPTLRHYREFVEEPFFKGYAATGPRGMLVLPEAEAARLDGIELPERDLYDLLNRLQSALEAHRRHEAEAAYRDLCAAAPGHRLTYQALRALGAYDGDARKRLEAAEGMRRLFPEDQRSLLGLFYELDGTGTRSDRLALLGEALALDSPHSAFYLRRAEILAEDARTHEAAAWNFRRAHRRAPQDAEALRGWASLLWEQREFAEATRLYRFASCLEEKREDLATTYARACRITGRAEEGIAFLHDRLTRFGHQAAYPAITMFLALEEADRLEDGFRILEWAMERRPDDAALMLFAARKFGAYGQRERAESLLAGADERGSRREWLSAAASLAEQRGDLEASRDHWRALLEIAPLTESAHSAIARITGELEGPEAAIAGIAATRADFPFHSGLASLHVNWLREAESPESEKVLRAMIEHDPDNDWARRELALELRRLGRVGEAVDEARRAVEADPHGSYSHSVLGGMLLAAGDRDAARDSLRRAVELDADNCGAIDWLFEASPGAAARHESIAFLSEQIERQATLARRSSTSSGSRSRCSTLRSCSPFWSARTRRAPTCGKAGRPACSSSSRWIAPPRRSRSAKSARSGSRSCPALGSTSPNAGLPAELRLPAEALRCALDINPSWSTACRALACALERTGDLDGAVAEPPRGRATGWCRSATASSPSCSGRLSGSRRSTPSAPPPRLGPPLRLGWTCWGRNG